MRTVLFCIILLICYQFADNRPHTITEHEHAWFTTTDALDFRTGLLICNDGMLRDWPTHCACVTVNVVSGRSLRFCFLQLTAILYTLLYLGASYVFTFHFIINYSILFPCAQYGK